MHRIFYTSLPTGLWTHTHKADIHTHKNTSLPTGLGTHTHTQRQRALTVVSISLSERAPRMAWWEMRPFPLSASLSEQVLTSVDASEISESTLLNFRSRPRDLSSSCNRVCAYYCSSTVSSSIHTYHLTTATLSAAQYKGHCFVVQL